MIKQLKRKEKVKTGGGFSNSTVDFVLSSKRTRQSGFAWVLLKQVNDMCLFLFLNPLCLTELSAIAGFKLPVIYAESQSSENRQTPWQKNKPSTVEPVLEDRRRGLLSTSQAVKDVLRHMSRLNIAQNDSKFVRRNCWCERIGCISPINKHKMYAPELVTNNTLCSPPRCRPVLQYYILPVFFLFQVTLGW